MPAPGSVHEGMLSLLLGDLRLAIELAHAAAVLDRPIPDDIRNAETSFELVRLFEKKDPHKLFPDLVLTLHDRDGKLIGVWIIEIQLKGEEAKRWRLPAYRAAAQLHFELTVDMLGISPSPAGRRWLHELDQVLYDPPAVLDLDVVIRICNPAASWLADPQHPAPEETPESLEHELVIARARPYAALFHAVHHARDLRAFQIVLAALIAARDLGPEAFRRYTQMIFAAGNKAMNDRLNAELTRMYPDDELSEWEREGGSYQKGLEQGLEHGLRIAIHDILELRGLPLDPSSHQRIEDCSDRVQLERWRTLAKSVSAVERLFD